VSTGSRVSVDQDDGHFVVVRRGMLGTNCSLFLCGNFVLLFSFSHIKTPQKLSSLASKSSS
jgi:hypothetical protein